MTIIESMDSYHHKLHSHLIVPSEATKASGSIVMKALNEMSESKTAIIQRAKAFHTEVKDFTDLITELMDAVSKVSETQEQSAFEEMEHLSSVAQRSIARLKKDFNL